MAVQVSNTEDIGSAALGDAVQSADAGVIRGVSGDGSDSGGNEADDSEDGGLHVEGLELFVLKTNIKDC